MEEILCPICLEMPRVPVKITCFPCGRQERASGPPCHSIIRVCFLCVREYFQLDTPVKKRAAVYKCFSCPVTVDTTSLGATDLYEKDFLLMSLDKRTDIQCIQCPFVGTQNDLDRHLGKDCPGRKKLCGECKEFYTGSEVSHQIKCCYFVHCSVCKEHVHVRTYQLHRYQVHLEDFCSYCVRWYPKKTEHRSRCSHRLVECNECHARLRFLDAPSHHNVHMKEHQDRIREYPLLMQNENDNLERKLQLSLTESFHDVYPFTG